MKLGLDLSDELWASLACIAVPTPSKASPMFLRRADVCVSRHPDTLSIAGIKRATLYALADKGLTMVTSATDSLGHETELMDGARRERLLQAMDVLGLASAADLGRLSNIPPSTARAYVSGKRKITFDAAHLLGHALGVEPMWLFAGVGSAPVKTVEPLKSGGVPVPVLMDDRDRLPVFGSAEGGAGQLIVSTDPFEYVERPYTLQGIREAYAILITGESMVPALKPGDKAWVNPRIPPVKGSECIFYGTDEDGSTSATVKELVGQTADEWKVRQWNPAKTFSLPKRRFGTVHRVVGKFSKV